MSPGGTLDVRLDLEFGRCRLVVAVRDDSAIDCVEQLPRGLARATVFPRLTKAFFAEKLAWRSTVVPVSGAAEVAPHLGIADVVVDLTCTGSTLKVNGLREVVTVLESSARLIAAPRAADAPVTDKSRALEELGMALGSVLRARGQRYLMANVPRDTLERVRQLLPGINGPTVMEILDGDRCTAVHAVVPEPSASTASSRS